MYNFQSYFSQFPRKHASDMQWVHEKVHVLQKSMWKGPLLQIHVKNSIFSQKPREKVHFHQFKHPPNPDLATGLQSMNA